MSHTGGAAVVTKGSDAVGHFVMSTDWMGGSMDFAVATGQIALLGGRGNILSISTLSGAAPAYALSDPELTPEGEIFYGWVTGNGTYRLHADYLGSVWAVVCDLGIGVATPYTGT
jgi:hypothetical protein